MSNFSNKPIMLPKGTDCILKENQIQIKGPNGSISKTIMPNIKITNENNMLSVKITDEKVKKKAMYLGLGVSLIRNMIKGVNNKFTKRLLLNGVGYRAQLNGKIINFKLGFSHEINYTLPEGIKAAIDKNVVIDLESVDKELIGQVASEIRKIRKVEPYKEKGIKYDGEYVRRKAGKTAVGGGGA
ncbi:MAG: 50S ribosomal protein L6 [Spirochaetes bacterium GWF1_41_5]|nr:MAG: 50S ribosomal protein L6 [Spirochaetes bacterium GWF1_41_5]HBE03495.1 50S ribosomal protein L6 [Spirochaetia bacterium]